jgi:PIN domain nuclease of toxin-antitoxin system
MNALLDTHALVWWVDGSKKLAREQHRATERAASTGTLFLSEISFWEIAMLVEAGKLTFREPLDEWLERAAAAPAVQRIGITPTIAREVASLSTTR